MTESTKQTQQIPPEVLQYLQGAPIESTQFDFLIGDWDVAATRYLPDGSISLQYKAAWHAQHLNERRMIVDDFKALAPTGQAVSSYVTLRTYCETNSRWEMIGLAALQPAGNAEWHGNWVEGEMRIEVAGKMSDGSAFKNKIRFFNIHENSFEWDSRISRDHGDAWFRAVSMSATRVQ